MPDEIDITTVCVPAATLALTSRRVEMGESASAAVTSVIGDPLSTVIENVPAPLLSCVPRYRLCVCWQEYVTVT